jgi:protein gp37
MIYQKFKICTTNLPFGCTDAEHGVDNWATFVLMKQLETKGFDKYGNAYEIEGNRKSGDPNTSCGNTIVNGIANAFVFAEELARKRGVDVM